MDVGKSVAALEVGDEVWAYAPIWRVGLLAEYVVLPEAYVAKKPELWSHMEAACFPYSVISVWDTLVSQANLQINGCQGAK